RKRVGEEMQQAVDALEFERAARLRDVAAALDALAQRQRVLDVRGGDQDVIGMARDGDYACLIRLRIRDGKLLGREVDFFENAATEDDAALLSAGVSRLYFGRGEEGARDLPREVLFPLEFEDRPLVEEVLCERAERRVRTHVPARGEKVRLLELANQNARHLLEERVVLAESARERADDVLYDLQESLDLKVVPRLMVCFDVSHTQGSEVVGSAVVFENGEPNKGEYRRFRIKGDWGNDDFRSIAEIVGRYFRRRLDEGRPLPELAIIDGGKGQLTAALAALEAAGVRDTAVCALAKRQEEVYLPDRSEPLRLPRTNAGLRLLQRIRNDAHRIAIGYNRKLRTRRTLASALREIPGIGPARQKALLERFGSVRGVRAATPEEIAQVPGFSEKLARQVHAFLKR